MTRENTQPLALFEQLITQTNHTYTFDAESSVAGFSALFGAVQSMGLDPRVTDDLRKGLWSIFHVEWINPPDFEKNRYIFAPNHVSDMDAPILGLLHPRIRIVAKTDWTNNAKLRQFLDLHYDLNGLERASLKSLRSLLADAIRYFHQDDENKHYLVFSQGTISDFNNNSPERISTVAQIVSERTDVPIVTMFVEQASLHHPTRIVFDEPMRLCKTDDFRTIWLNRQKALQNALQPSARRPNLKHKHANNNKPGDPFF